LEKTQFYNFAKNFAKKGSWVESKSYSREMFSAERRNDNLFHVKSSIIAVKGFFEGFFLDI
jgi:hypothetical protein